MSRLFQNPDTVQETFAVLLLLCLNFMILILFVLMRMPILNDIASAAFTHKLHV